MDAEVRLEHDRPNGRPIHPECALLRTQAEPYGNQLECDCDARWEGWNGTTEHAERIAASHDKIAGRRRGWVDALEGAKDPNVDSERAGRLERGPWGRSLETSTEVQPQARLMRDGFWSKAEQYRCSVGRDFLNGELRTVPTPNSRYASKSMRGGF